MSRTSKSPMKAARVAYHAGRKALPRYAHKFSRKGLHLCPTLCHPRATQVLQDRLPWLHEILSEWSDFRKILALDDQVPHFTTSQKASGKRLGAALIRKLLTQTLAQFYRHPDLDDDLAWVQRIDLPAADSTGFESNRCSRYFAKG